MPNRARALWIARIAGVAVAIAITASGMVAGCDEGGGEIAITGINPRVGPLQGDLPVKITGRNFRTDIGYAVYFGNNRATSVTILDPETLLVTTPETPEPGDVDITIRADDGPAFRVPAGFRFEDMGGSVVEGLGAGAQKAKKGNLAY